MFENLIAQPASNLLSDDILNNRLPPSILFSGPNSSGKLTCALELARILSCTDKALWTCSCSACAQHRLLIHPDLALLGPRSCSLEIKAASQAFLRSKSSASRFLFLRSIQKLLLRFLPAVFDSEDSKFSKVSQLISEVEEYLELIRIDKELQKLEESQTLNKTITALLDTTEKLEEDFLYESIPVSAIRTLSTWARLSPIGKHKIIIVENADTMQESSRNAFLKILEEPPKNVYFILLTPRRGAIMPTILSRVRTYAFVDRDKKAQHEVITRVFHEKPQDDQHLAQYFNSFLPIGSQEIQQAALSFFNLLITEILDENKKPLVLIKTIVDTEIHKKNVSLCTTLSDIVKTLNRCKPNSIWHLFLSQLAFYIHLSLKNIPHDSKDLNQKKDLSCSREIEIFFKWLNFLRLSRESSDIYNLNALASLELLFSKMKDAT